MPHGYDLNSNLTSMTDPAGIVTNYVYDTLNRLTDIKDISNQIISHYDYDALSRRTGKSFAVSGSPFAVNYNYNIASQLLSITNLPTTITDSYTYDNVGNRLSLTDINGLHNYSYDNVYRLLNSTNPNEAYTYDPVGNRNPLTQLYNAGNRLLEDNTYTYNYDLNGNMTSKVKKIGGETTTYAYNSEDQLIGVNGNISYKYDSLGRRIEKNVGGTITRYVYDGEDIVQELDENNQVIAAYVHGPSIDEPIALDKAGQKYYYISDGLGSITAIVDSTGTVVNTYRYDSFGNILNSSGTISQPFTYTGREYDSETGLYYLRARYYDPKIGRFLQQDPIWSKNLYSYCGNNPVNYIDPLGLWKLSLNAGFHVPFTPGPVAYGPNFSSSYKNPFDLRNKLEAEPTSGEVVIGSFIDAGVSAGISDFDNTGCDGVTISIGSGRYGGIQLTLKETFDRNKSILNPFRYLNGVSVGLGLGFGSPVQVTVPLKR